MRTIKAKLPRKLQRVPEGTYTVLAKGVKVLRGGHIEVTLGHQVSTLADLVVQFGGQQAAATKCGVSLPTFNRWLRGETKPRGKNTLRRLRQLGVR